MPKTINKDEVIALMKKRQGERSNQDFAVELGISKQYLGDIYQGRRDPGETVLTALGLEKKEFFIKKQNGAGN